MLRPAPFRDGQNPKTSRARPQDYEDDVKRLLNDAIAFFSLYLFTDDAFPGLAKQTELATRAWNAACNKRETLVSYELSDRMIRAITSRKSTARGDVSDNIRSTVAEVYGFRRSAAPVSERHNVELAAALVENGMFHHKIAFFGNARTGAGFVHKELFDPIRNQSLAFILTVIRAHISEWSTGHLLKEDFTEVKNARFYEGFVKDIEKYGAGNNATAWANIRKRLYSKAFRAGGGVTLQVHTARMSQAAMQAATAELAGRSGLTDSEEEAEFPEEAEA
uniref:Nitrogen regulatory protein NUT1 n=1 Tax=Ganoderma boninense TaxID=34458 RepID=A0A5K1K773_9APHY|nr:Nitrogen regulatory protein NUT1 [Ganoderma boninense]